MPDPVKKVLKLINKFGYYPTIKILNDENDEDPIFNYEGKKILTFNSCNYLGLSNNDRIKEVAAKAIKQYGIHPSNSPLVGGLWRSHKQFEIELANFFGYDDCLLFSSTTAVNLGIIPAVSNLPMKNFHPILKLYTGDGESEIFSDELNHATIVDGTKLSKQKTTLYNHLDLKDLEEKLIESKSKRKIIITDGVFSMDGHLITLPNLLEISKKYKAELIVDDAHSVGVLGENGNGIQSHYHLKGQIDYYIASLSKGFGLMGGCVCADHERIEYLRVASRTYVFSRTYPLFLARAGLEVLKILNSSDGKERIKKLWENTKYLIDNLNKLGFETLKTETPLIPILIGDEELSMKVSAELYNKGIFIPPMRWPAVPKKRARIRLIVNSHHQKKHLDHFLESMEEIGKREKII